MSSITQIGMEQTLGELESYGIKEKTLDEEFKKLKTEVGVSEPVERKIEPEELKLPEVPKKEVAKTREKSEKEKG